jgi:hypothetical protein
MTHDCLRLSLYRDRAIVEFTSELAAKTRAVLRSLRLWWDSGHSQDTVTAFIRLSNVSELYCRAVSCKANLPQSTVYLDFSIARARVLQPIPATVPSLQNTCFLSNAQIPEPGFLTTFA